MPLSKKRKSELMGGSYSKILMEHEAALGVLYRTFASAFSGHRKFWDQLADEETGHINIISMLEDKTKQGEWGFKRPSYLYSSVADSVEFVQNVIARMEREGMTMRDAVAAAVRFERGMLESHYMDVVDDDVPEVKRVLDRLKKESEEHLARVEKKARLCKWDFLGKRVCKPKDHIAMQQRTSSQKATLAQRELLDCLIALEESLNSLYRAYQEMTKDEEGFWARYAAEELEHAAMLKGLKTYLDKGALFTNLYGFDKEKIVRQIESVMNSENEARAGDVTMGKALGVALQHESALAESSFYRDVRSSAPEFQHIAGRMREHLNDHVKRLQDKIVSLSKHSSS